MPWREFNRVQGWLMPPSADELLPPEHPARVVAAFVDSLTTDDWAALGITLLARRLGAGRYHPRMLLAVWLYGFMTGQRSSRKLERACREQLPFIWLAGGQRPDHNTLWRFYRRHRGGLSHLLTLTVRAAVKLGLIDWSLQAADGTKIAGDASNRWTLTREQLERLEERSVRQIREIEETRDPGNAAQPMHQEELDEARELLRRARGALDELRRSGQRYVSLVDADARLLRRSGGGGHLTGYNAQALASFMDGADAGAAFRSPHAIQHAGASSRAREEMSRSDKAGHSLGAVNAGRPLASAGPPLELRLGGETNGRGHSPSSHFLLLAADVTQNQNDTGELTGLVDQAQDNAGQRAELTVADAGYFSAEMLAAMAERGMPVVVPAQREFADHPYHWRHFRLDPATDTYNCPEGQTLTFRQTKYTRQTPARIYGADPAVCRACPAFGECTTSEYHGRTITVSTEAETLEAHRRWMGTRQAEEALRRRPGLIEPVFAIIKEQMGGARFLLRGLESVKAEWLLLAVAFNLRTLSNYWRRLLDGLSPMRAGPGGDQAIPL